MEKDDLFESFKKFALDANDAKKLFGGNDTPSGTTGDTCSGDKADDCDSESETVPIPQPV
jgi:hypothetical protein